MLSSRFILVCVVSIGTFLTFLHQLSRPSSASLSSLSNLGTSNLRDLLLKADSGGGAWDHDVINLAHRADRREYMSRMAEALALKITFVEGVSIKNPVVPWVMERLLDDQLEGETVEGGLKELTQAKRWGPKGDLTWRQNAVLSLSSSSPTYPLHSHPSNETLIFPPDHLSSETLNPLAHIACSLAHVRAFELAIKNNDQSFLVLEDDVDAEFGLVDRWSEMKRGLDRRSEGWDMVYLGWIWSDEKAHKPTFSPLLRRSFTPQGLHAYSLSHRGVRRLYNRLLSSPSFLSHPLDDELPTHIIQASYYAEEPDWTFEAWSAVPPLILPGDGTLGTDIAMGAEQWGGILSDSTRSRIAAFDGHPRDPLSDEAIGKMFGVFQGM